MCHSVRSLSVALLVVAVALHGCTARYRDASTEHPLLLNRTIRATQPIVLHAVTTIHYPKQVIDEYHITKEPGFGGPEVIFRRKFPAGTTLRILQVQHCSNCPFSDAPKVVVEPPLPEYADHNVTIDLERKGDEFKVPGFEFE
jgi:hypothetical protein